jgi:hypothetical protein
LKWKFKTSFRKKEEIDIKTAKMIHFFGKNFQIKELKLAWG